MRFAGWLCVSCVLVALVGAGCSVGVTSDNDAGSDSPPVALPDVADGGTALDAPALDAPEPDVVPPLDASLSPDAGDDGVPLPDVPTLDDAPTADTGCPAGYGRPTGVCEPSCGTSGGNTCAATLDPCAGQTLLPSYDCTFCCNVPVVPPPPPPPAGCAGSSSGSSNVWTCTADHSARQRCVSSSVQTEACAHGCVSQPLGVDDYCAAACAGSASGTSSIWTCTADHNARQRCVSGTVSTEACAHGCVSQPLGTDDYCATGCTASASGTSPIWTCTPDHTSRQHCVTGAVVTESCPHGCVSQPLGTDDYCAGSCTGSASGTSGIWTCTADHNARQRCVSGAVATESCPHGCVSQPLGTDDYCAAAPPPPGSGEVSCAYIQWWNRPYSWTPGYYAIRGTYHWDNDLNVSAGTPIQLRHDSQLVRQGVYAWGFMPEFIDWVTGERFALLHLQPARRLTTAVGTVYPAGTLVGYSGGNTTDTGYCVAIPGCGTANCSTGTCVYSTGQHLCVQTIDAFHTAFPTGTDACR